VNVSVGDPLSSELLLVQGRSVISELLYITNKILFLSVTLLLNGCSVYKGSFDCKSHKGIGCESVSKVNDLINDDKLDEFTDNVAAKNTSNKKKKCSCQDSPNKKSTNINKTNKKNTALERGKL
jgi:hypothetical protein